MLNRRAVAEVFVVFVEPAFSGSQFFKGRNEFDSLNPFDLFEAEFEFIAQPERSAVEVGQTVSVHFVGKDGVGVAHVRDVMHLLRYTLYCSGFG